jgi:hypothetical protein
MAASAALDWVLAAALGAPNLVLPELPRGERLDALRWLRTLDWAARVATLRRSEELAEALGLDACRSLQMIRLAARRNTLQRTRVTEELVCCARECNAPFVLLKGQALAALGICATSTRFASDIDVLCAPEASLRVHAALVARGFTPRSPENDHQLSGLTAPEGIGVEIHFAVPAMAADGGPATFAMLRADGWLQMVFDVLWHPEPNWLGAHLLVHGLVQHGNSPHFYPQGRVFADIADLLPQLDAAKLRRALPRASADLENVVHLVAAISKGRRATELPRELRSSLDHVLAANASRSYAVRLTLQRVRQLLQRSTAEWPRMVLRALGPGSRLRSWSRKR